MTTWRQARRWMAWGGAALGGAALALALAAPATAQAPVQLRFMSWYFGEDPAGPALKALFAEFEKRNPNIKVVAEQVTSAERVPKFTAAMEAGRECRSGRPWVSAASHPARCKEQGQAAGPMTERRNEGERQDPMDYCNSEARDG